MATEGQTPLSDLLNESSEPNETPDVAEAAPEPEEQQDAAPQPRDESGRFAKKGEDEGASPAPAEDPPFEHAAVKGERTRRQAAEQERENLRTELEALKQQFQQLQQPPAPPPSIWEDEQGALQHLGQQVVGQATFNARLDMSEMLASQAHDDFDEMRGRFLQMMEANPALQRQALEAKHPWEKAYQIAKNAAQMEELGAVDLADIEAKMREKIMAEMQQGSTPVPPLAAPPSLTGERNVGTRSGPVWGGPKSLDDLLPH